MLLILLPELLLLTQAPVMRLPGYKESFFLSSRIAMFLHTHIHTTYPSLIFSSSRCTDISSFPLFALVSTNRLAKSADILIRFQRGHFHFCVITPQASALEIQPVSFSRSDLWCLVGRRGITVVQNSFFDLMHLSFFLATPHVLHSTCLFLCYSSPGIFISFW